MERHDHDIFSHSAWHDQIPDDQWAVYRTVIARLRDAGIPFALGGAFALATYTGHWRNTKDLDLFILPEARDAVVDLLTNAGLRDYYDEQPYDRGWIYRAHQGEFIIDAIWSMANRCGFVDQAWLTRGPQIDVRGEQVRIVPAEEVIWNKLYILHWDRWDWGDILNIVYASGDRLDWNYLLDRVGEEDAPLLRGVLSVFVWLCPGRTHVVPTWVWQRVGLPQPQQNGGPEIDQTRVRLLDSRPWFGPDRGSDPA